MFAATVGCRQPAGGGFTVKGWQSVPGFPHHSHHFIIRNAVSAVGEQGVIGAGKRLSCCKGIALDAGNLHQPGHEVAGQTQALYIPAPQVGTIRVHRFEAHVVGVHRQLLFWTQMIFTAPSGKCDGALFTAERG